MSIAEAGRCAGRRDAADARPVDAEVRERGVDGVGEEGLFLQAHVRADELLVEAEPRGMGPLSRRGADHRLDQAKHLVGVLAAIELAVAGDAEWEGDASA